MTVAFASAIAASLTAPRRTAFTSPLSSPCAARLPQRSRAPATNVVMSGDTESGEAEKKPAASSPPFSSTSTPDEPAASPSFDTAVFSDFVDNAQAKIDEIGAQVTDIDTEALGSDVKAAGIGLVDNAIAGDWLNRGELYGGVQLLFVALLLRSPGFLDSFVGFLVGPVMLLVGAAISGKAAWDLGLKQLSIWPAPVPGAELRTDGLYSIVRHPVYSGLLLACLGYSAATGSAERLGLTLAFAYFISKKINVEEDFLQKAYPDYEDYQDKVWFKVIPRVW